MARILLIDDDPDFSEFVRTALVENDHRVDRLDGPERGPKLLEQVDYDLVLLDNRMPGMSGIEFLRELEKRDLRVPVILMTGDPTSDTAIEAMNLGAFDYVVKPLEIEDLIGELEPLIARAEEIAASMREHVRLPGETCCGDGPQLLGNSKAMQEVYKRIGMVVRSNVPVLILGETGTGKELIARAIHSHSPRRQRPFVAMNCTALNESLLDSELFGYERGAFTGAEKLRKGRFEYAHTGTLFLDELGDMPPMLQAKLLRVLQDGEIQRIGGNDAITVDVRVVSATHRDLDSGVRDGEFRLDLLNRLNAFPIFVPPLRERGDDLYLLADHFLYQAAQRRGRPVPSIHKSARARLREYAWPGNVRELKNVIGRAVLICRGPQITAEEVEICETPAKLNSMPNSAGDLHRWVRTVLDCGRENAYKALLEDFERELLQQVLANCDGNKVHMARRLGVSRGWLLKKLREYGLDLRD